MDPFNLELSQRAPGFEYDRIQVIREKRNGIYGGADCARTSTYTVPFSSRVIILVESLISEPEMTASEYNLKPVNKLTTGAIGPPGKRVFYLQARDAVQLVTLIVEKQQVQLLAAKVEEFLTELDERLPDLPKASIEINEDDMALEEPIDPAFRIDSWALGMMTKMISWFWWRVKLRLLMTMIKLPPLPVSGVHDLNY